MWSRELVAYCDKLMSAKTIDDYCPNGLQVQGRADIQTIVTGVTACQALIDAAVVKNADAILVHHGFFWKGESPCITGMKYRRLKALLTHGINVIAYHLPLDVLPRLGNNAQFADRLDINVTGEMVVGKLPGLVLQGDLRDEMTPESLAQHINQRLHTSVQHISSGKRTLRRVAWCTGAGQSFLSQCEGVDAFLSGEISEQTVHMAREMGIDYFACGHHATERLGIRALGQHLAETFSFDVQFIDVPNPV
jgi:dinuclear metal center YbgI/SA1388 family protein